MKVLFLGTGAAEGFPAIFSDTPINREARSRGGKDLRTRSSILIDGVVKVDLPPDTLCHVHRHESVNLARLQHLLFTHSHDDHFAVRELQYLSPNFAPDRKAPLNVYATNDLIKKMILEMSHFFEAAPLRFHSIAPFEALSVGHLEVVPITAHHKVDELCLNFLIREGGRCVLYASDTGWYDEPTWEYLSEVSIDTLIVECGKGVSENGYAGHMSLEDCVRMKERLTADGALAAGAPVYLTHICHTGLLLHDELSDRAAPHGISVAYDGLEIDV